ncbi:CBS domain-containing protein [Aliiroseovarius sp.]|uniref:CBS domain-containing protein n=1 Tax=Aliiroseovarius sp. TaxID=1872442 RepID=UPI002626758C|nr:CBS domain-containing protein [Aliiroseovarius sp.]
MTKTVVTGRPDMTVSQAAELMSQHHISAIPVLDDAGAIVGIVSEGDLMRRVEGANDPPRSWWLSLFSETGKNAGDFIRERGQHLRDIMTRHVTTVTPATPVGQIARVLEKNKIKRVPVVEGGKLIGIVSRANLLQALAAQPVVHLRSEASVDEKRDIVLGALAQVPGLNAVHLNVIVTDNRVDIWGIVNSDDEEAAARVALEAIDGLGEISMHLGRIPAYAWGI